MKSSDDALCFAFSSSTVKKRMMSSSPDAESKKQTMWQQQDSLTKVLKFSDDIGPRVKPTVKHFYFIDGLDFKLVVLNTSERKIEFQHEHRNCVII